MGIAFWLILGQMRKRLDTSYGQRVFFHYIRKNLPFHSGGPFLAW